MDEYNDPSMVNAIRMAEFYNSALKEKKSKKKKKQRDKKKR